MLETVVLMAVLMLMLEALLMQLVPETVELLYASVLIPVALARCPGAIAGPPAGCH